MSEKRNIIAVFPGESVYLPFMYYYKLQGKEEVFYTMSPNKTGTLVASNQAKFEEKVNNKKIRAVLINK